MIYGSSTISSAHLWLIHWFIACGGTCRFQHKCPFVFKIVKHKPETVVLSATTMRSCLVFPHATVAHSGTYVCHAHESTQDQKAFASVNITVLGEKNTLK